MLKNNAAENATRIPHEYKEGDQVMLKIGTENKYEQPYSGQHEIKKVHENENVQLQMGAVTDTVNIRRLYPYKDRANLIHGGNAVCGIQRAK